MQVQAQLAEAVAGTEAGSLRGLAVDGVFSFKGVPYGSAGPARRFQPPLGPAPWSGVRDATSYPNRSPEPGELDWFYPGVGRIALPRGLPFSEDCLHLNIWTPGLRDGSRRPVLVWLHGGGFHGGTGSAPETDGTNLARRGDAVIVSVTHRLNAFGFLYLSEFPGCGDLADSGNVGMLDIVQALKWISANIEEFGGDPSNVTVFGHSGGGGKVMTLMAMPAAKGLFHRAICMSGSTGVGGRTTEYAAADAEELLHCMGLRPRQADALRTMPMERLWKGTVDLKQRQMFGSKPWGAFSDREWKPVVDGRTLTARPWLPGAPAEADGVPLLVGTTRDEVRIHIGRVDPATGFDFPWAELEPRLASAMKMDPLEAIRFYRDRFPELSPPDVQFKLFTFWRWRHSAIWTAELRQRRAAAPTYMYRIDQGTAIEGGKWRAFHGVEVPYIFDTVHCAEAMYHSMADARRMTDQMSEVWLAFARSGDPNCGAVPAWPAYEDAARATMMLGLEPHVENDPEAEERRFFSAYPPRVSK